MFLKTILVLLVSLGVFSGIGLSLKNPRKTEMTVKIPTQAKVLWDTVTNVKRQVVWRSDLREVELARILHEK